MLPVLKGASVTAAPATGATGAADPAFAAVLAALTPDTGVADAPPAAPDLVHAFLPMARTALPQTAKPLQRMPARLATLLKDTTAFANLPAPKIPRTSGKPIQTGTKPAAGPRAAETTAPLAPVVTPIRAVPQSAEVQTIADAHTPNAADVSKNVLKYSTTPAMAASPTKPISSVPADDPSSLAAAQAAKSALPQATPDNPLVSERSENPVVDRPSDNATPSSNSAPRAVFAAAGSQVMDDPAFKSMAQSATAPETATTPPSHIMAATKISDQPAVAVMAMPRNPSNTDESAATKTSHTMPVQSSNIARGMIDVREASMPHEAATAPLSARPSPKAADTVPLQSANIARGAVGTREASTPTINVDTPAHKAPVVAAPAAKTDDMRPAQSTNIARGTVRVHETAAPAVDPEPRMPERPVAAKPDAKTGDTTPQRSTNVAHDLVDTGEAAIATDEAETLIPAALITTKTDDAAPAKSANIARDVADVSEAPALRADDTTLEEPGIVARDEIAVPDANVSSEPTALDPTRSDPDKSDVAPKTSVAAGKSSDEDPPARIVDKPADVLGKIVLAPPQLEAGAAQLSANTADESTSTPQPVDVTAPAVNPAKTKISDTAQKRVANAPVQGARPQETPARAAKADAAQADIAQTDAAPTIATDARQPDVGRPDITRVPAPVAPRVGVQPGMSTNPAAVGIPQSIAAHAVLPPANVAASVAPSPPDAAPQANIGALAVAIAAHAGTGAKHFDIRLDPPELGRVDVHLSIDRDGRTEATLCADRPQTLDLLQRDQHTLQRALKDAGLDLSNTSLNFSLKGQDRQGDGGGAFAARARGLSNAATASGDAAPASISPMSHAPDSARLDIRV